MGKPLNFSVTQVTLEDSEVIGIVNLHEEEEITLMKSGLDQKKMTVMIIITFLG